MPYCSPKARTVLILCAVVSIVTPLFAHRLRIDFDRTTNFSRYKTYSWLQPDIEAPGSIFPNQLMQLRIMGFIEEALSAKGLKRIPSGGELSVRYQMNVIEVPQYTTLYDNGPGWGWGWDSGFSTTTVQTFPEGTLVVDIVDATRNQLVFQGTSTQSISSRPEKNTRKLAKAVNEVFEKYPPRD